MVDDVAIRHQQNIIKYFNHLQTSITKPTNMIDAFYNKKN
jgi:hypothetical protein